MITTEKNHLFRGTSRDFENDVLFAKSLFETGNEHNIMMAMSYLSARARADLYVSLNLEDQKSKEFVADSVVEQNDLAIEYRRKIESVQNL